MKAIIPKIMFNGFKKNLTNQKRGKMKKNLAIVLIFVSISITIYACEKTQVTDTDKYLIITGLKFRKHGSIGTEILRVGQRRRRGTNTFDPKFLPMIEGEIKAKLATEAYSKETAKAAYEAAVKAKLEIVEGDAGSGITTALEKKGTYKIFKIYDIYDLVKELNSEANKENIERMIKYGKDARIITSAAYVFNYEANEKIDKHSNLELSVKHPKLGDPELSVKIENANETVTTLSSGTVFAFEYARFCWQRKERRIIVSDLSIDRPGFDSDCPSGTTDDASKL